MDHLFAPWRSAYLTQAREAGCVFCNRLREADGPANGVIYRGRECAVFLNLYPYTAGHLMVVPVAHAARLGEMAATAREELIELAARCEAILEAEYGCEGLNVGINLGEAAGAGIAGHLHLHVVPRWRGDVNFMTSVGATRVLPETLEQTWQRLQPRFRSL